jgi:hypothetical protein
VEKSSASHTIIRQYVGDQRNQLAMLGFEHGVFLRNQQFQKRDGILPVHLRELLIALFKRDDFVEPGERRVGQKILAAPFQEGGDGQIERYIRTELVRKACRTRPRTRTPIRTGYCRRGRVLIWRMAAQSPGKSIPAIRPRVPGPARADRHRRECKNFVKQIVQIS